MQGLSRRMDERELLEEERERERRHHGHSRSRSRSRGRRTRSRGRSRSHRARSRSRRARSRSRSRSHRSARSRSRSRNRRYGSRSPDRPRLWADRDLDETVDYEADPQFSDEEGDGPGDLEGGSQLAEVSEHTNKLLTSACTRGMSLDARKRTRSKYKLPHVEATRTPRVDHVMRALAPPAAKSTDRELSKIQTYMLDSLAPISCLLDHAEKMSVEDLREASSTAASLIGNANAQMSRLRREKFVTSVNKNLLPLVKDNSDFASVSPNLFGPDFSKRAKDHLDQVKSLRHTAPVRPFQRGAESSRKPFFRKGFSSGRGSARGRGGGHNFHKGNQGDKQSRP